MMFTDLIRRVDGAEMPVAGCWRIPTNHGTLVYASHRAVGRRIGGRAPMVSGVLELDERPSDSSLLLTVGVWGGLGRLLGDERLTDITLRATSIEPTPAGQWQIAGEVQIGGMTRAVPMTVDYHGVYRAGNGANAWLTIHATVDPAAFGRRGRRPVELRADLLAVGPPHPCYADELRLVA